jgi:CHAT domain-containing protein
MRRLIALAAIGLVCCRSVPTSLEGELRKAQQWLRTEQFGLVLNQVDGWLRVSGQRHDLRSQWRFRMVKAEALLGIESSPGDVLVLLTGQGDMPSGPDWAADRARWFTLQVRAMNSLGQRDHNTVTKLLDRAAQAAKEANRPDLAAEATLRRGLLFRQESKLPEAHQLYSQLLAESRQRHDRYLEARVENAVGVLLQLESKHDEAIPDLVRSRSLAVELGASDTAARAEGTLGFSYFRLGDYDNALASYGAAQSHFSSAGNLYEIQIWAGDIGNVYYSRGDLQTAVDYYTHAVAVARRVDARRWLGTWLGNLAVIAIDRREWDVAEKYNDEACRLMDETDDTPDQARCSVSAAQIAAGRGDFKTAHSLFESALHKYVEDPRVLLDAHAGLAGLYSRQNGFAKAELEFRDAIIAIEKRQAKLSKDDYRLSWLDSLISFYQQYVDFLIAQKQPDRALEAAESSRAKVLTSQPIPQLSASGYQRLASHTHAVLLEYWLSPTHSYLWVITPDKVFCHTLPPKSEILPLVRSYRAVVTGGRNPLDVAGDTGLKLYNALLAPAMADAGAATQFIVVPDDELYSLNFETLPDGNNSNRFWIDRATVRISPSLNYLASNAPAKRPHGFPRLLLIGDPTSSLPQYPHLEFASQEMSAIATTMSAAHPVVVQRAAATPESYASSIPGNFGFIHFSAHAAAAAKRESALDSSVILSGPPDKCRLVARDVLAVPLNAELVTVSACRSAGGKTYGGEGLVGFAWAFMKAGAGNVIAGLWDVNDRSTVQLMTGLYSQIAAGASSAEALRSSKLALIHGGGSYAKPFYWAPFQLYTARSN